MIISRKYKVGQVHTVLRSNAPERGGRAVILSCLPGYRGVGGNKRDRKLVTIDETNNGKMKGKEEFYKGKCGNEKWVKCGGRKMS